MVITFDKKGYKITHNLTILPYMHKKAALPVVSRFSNNFIIMD